MLPSEGPIGVVLEQHYSAPEIAKAWHLSENAVRDLFRDEPGVLRIVRPGRRNKREYTTYRVPLSVLQRVHAARCRLN
jgi:hypothetical protein